MTYSDKKSSESLPIKNKNDIFNYEQDSKECEQMKKVMVRVNSKNDDKINEEFINMAKKMENA